jgi:hypothetical protein
MNLNQQMLSDLAAKLGLEESGQTAVKTAIDMADDYKDKNDEAILAEIRRLKKVMKANPKQYQKQIATIKSLRVVMDEEQQKRLDRILILLEE